MVRLMVKARHSVCVNSSVTMVEIAIANDESTDGGVKRANRYTDLINLIVFPQNKGYGGAIKEAWQRSDADPPGFLDANGTRGLKLSLTAIAQDADVASGCYVDANSQISLSAHRKLYLRVDC